MTEQNNTVVDDTQTDPNQTNPSQTTEAQTGETVPALDAPAPDAPATAEPAGDDDDTVDDTVDEAGEARRRPTKVADLEREGEVAADFLETLLDIADLDGDIDVDVDGDRAAVSIVDSDEGRVPRRLVGQDGKVLDALQELTRLAVQSATGERSRLMLDVAGHRAERRASLVEVAHAVIEQVKASGEKAELEPMTAFERKVVHDEVLAAGLTSESDGVEPRRFVVVLPA
ncbi:spoIIIJ-associated protein [Phycicoccus badiiscoriae]|uniref:SpoIIIJ-associated protein n=1 Tax=Pedococcus badiiscoriae TaxID=642776 RepID=A0A852WNH4_9MICO|nr:R3H domain-containing nucleic acid-binding protein [Pedococcus badiiscoriae]NYG06936.1 spoIIIJ-associated protein [Pedococcus badiiscoriae]